MNPVLLKPQSEIGAQVVVQGRVIGNARAREYQELKPKLMPAVLESYARIGAEADLVLVEGAGSAAEINLRAGDIANMGFARAADMPGRADRRHRSRRDIRANSRNQGGARARRRRHDRAASSSTSSAATRACSKTAWRSIAERTGWRALGLLPFFAARDAPAGGRRVRPRRASKPARTAWSRSPCRCWRASPISTSSTRCAGACRAACLRPSGRGAAARRSHHPARQQGDDRRSRLLPPQGLGHRSYRAWRRGGRVLGICGGYQMLGTTRRRP